MRCGRSSARFVLREVHEMPIRALATDLRVLPMQTRMPFRYGIATLTALPHLFMRVEVEVDGQRVWGLASEGLAPKWFTKDPATSVDDDIAGMLEVIEAACRHVCACGPAATVFDLWWALYHAQQAWAAARGHPPLLAGLGASLVERALIDAFCRARQTTFAAAIRDGSLGVQLAMLHPALAGRSPAELLPRQPLTRIVVRHTVGLSDPLTDADIAPEDRLDDGLPQSLAACIERYGLTHFKIKLCGDAMRDHERLRRIAQLLDRLVPAYAWTLDGNEQFQQVAQFQALWEQICADPQLATLRSRLLFVEQPFPRARALCDQTGAALLAWPARPPIIIDESDDQIDSLPLALQRGYAGTSHKNCKGVFKGVANACLAAARSAAGQPVVLSGEDLCNVGPIALLQDLAVMASLGVRHVERNGHHYFRGLSMYAEDLQAAIVQAHPDLYRWHARGFAHLAIDAGTIALDSVVRAPFGYGLPFETARYRTLADYRVASPF
jgi:hypothetical protein